MTETARKEVATHSRKELIEDARYLAKTLQDAHPDPYLGHGGRVHFHRHVEELIKDIPDEGESIGEFYPRIAEIAALARDGHTGVYPPTQSEFDVDGQLPLGFIAVGSELYVNEVYDNSFQDLLGGRLLSVEDILVSELTDRQSRLDGADNVFQDRFTLTTTIRDVTPLRYLLGESVEAPMVTIEKTDGSTVEKEVDPIGSDSSDESTEPVAELESSVRLPETSGEPAYRFLDTDRSIALLSLPDMVSYREAHELLRSAGYERGKEIAHGTYGDLIGGSVPKDYGEVVAALPSAIDILTDMVEAMAAAKTNHLVIDTRQNTGGNSLLTNALTYVLYGWDGIERSDENHIQVPKESELYHERIGGDGPIGDTDNPAGFDFGPYFDRNDVEKRLDRQRDWLAGSRTFAAELDSGEYEAFYCPDSVSVVTSAMTYSAGAEPAFTLSELGAIVVGVPPSQAPNVPRDMLQDELPNTELKIRTAYRHVESRPEIDGRVFRPDLELTPERFEAMGRTGDASVQLALDANGDTTKTN